MISKNNFINYLAKLEKTNKIYDAINEAGKELDMFEIYDCEYSTVIIDILQEVFNDESEWITYFIYDLDFGEKWRKGCVTDNGEDVPLRNAGDLYDLLTAGGDKIGRTEE